MSLKKRLFEFKNEFSEGISLFLEQTCERLPLNLAFYEKNGMCTAKSEICKYSQFLKKEEYLCRKMTYTLDKGYKPQLI
jgi:hypothetical protein